MGVWIYPVIFVAKIVEVSLATVRTVLITKGERRLGAIIGFFEVILWIIIVSSVISGLAEDPLKVVVYALGFALGNYFGSMIEEKIGIGLAEIVTIVNREHGESLAEHLRDRDFAVTVLEGDGKTKPKNVLFLFLPRKRVREALKFIKEHEPSAVVTVSETKPLYGGYGLWQER